MSQSKLLKGTVILTIATLLSKILGSIFRIPLQNIAGDEVLGIFSLVYPVYMVALYLSVAGLPLAISKLIADARAKQNGNAIQEIYRTSSILAILFGIFSFSFIFIFSEGIANMLGGPATRPALVVVAATLLVAPYMAIYRGFFQGYGDMQPTAVSQVIEQLIRVLLILGIAYILVMQDYSNEIVAAGVMVGSVIGAIASLIYLRIKYRRFDGKPKQNPAFSAKRFFSWSKTILVISIPIAFGAITMALFNFVDSFTISYGLRTSGAETSEVNYLYGIYGRGQALVQIATVFATSIVLPLVPYITEKLSAGDFKGTRKTIENTHRLTHMISWPAAAGLFGLTLPLNLALFTNLEGSTMLSIINISAVFTSLTLVGTGILQGMNAQRLGAWVIVGGVILKIFLNIILIQFYGLNGAAISTLIVYFLLFAVNTALIFRRIRFKMITSETLRIILASIIMGAIIGLPTVYFDIGAWSRLGAVGYLGIAIPLGAALYFAMLFVMRVVSKEDLKNLPYIGKYINKRESARERK